MADEKRDGQETVQGAMQDAAQLDEKTEMKSSGDSIFTGIYERLPNISIKALDWFILICVIAFVAVILIGVLEANHMFLPMAFLTQTLYDFLFCFIAAP